MSELAPVDVAIVGAGIAGSALALSLAGSLKSGNGLSVALIEAQSLAVQELPRERALGDFDNRVSALTPRAIAQLDALGAWEAVAQYRQCGYQRMSVWDGQGTGRIDFDCAELGVESLGHIVENRAINNALLQGVLASPQIHCYGGHKLESCERTDGGEMRLQLESGQHLQAALVVGADGALSRVREMLEFKTREWDYGHRAIVATVEVEHSHAATAWQRFLPTGPLAFLPLPSGVSETGEETHFCSIVWSLDSDLVDEILALDEAEFCRRLGEAIEHTLGEVKGCSQRFAFPLRQRHAVDYVQPGVALVGDAAHTIHPLAGQGINLGLQDVSALAEELLAGHHRGIHAGDGDLLRRYQRRRKGENLIMMAAMDGFKRLFEQEALPLRWLRNAGMRTVAQVGPIKQRLMRHAMGID